MKLRSRDFGDASGSCSVTAPSSILNEAPKPRLRRSVAVIRGLNGGFGSSMKLRSRDFGDAALAIGLARIGRSSMKLRSRDFGDGVRWLCRYGRVRLLNEAPKPRLRRYGVDFIALDLAHNSSMKLRSRDFGDISVILPLLVVARSSMKLRSRDFGDMQQSHHRR